MNQTRLKYLLDRYLSHQATGSELEEYNAWFEEVLREKELDQEWQDPEKIKAFKFELYQEIVRQIKRDEVISLKNKSIRFLPWVAAVLILVATGIYHLMQPANSSDLLNTQQFYVVQPDIIVVTNGSDSNRIVYLKDGSSVVLSANTKIIYKEPLGPARRDIQLIGKALFNVHKDSSRPFTVYSDSIATTALGTSFTITAYPGKDARVALHEGKVVVKNNTSGRSHVSDIFLSPGQVAVYSRKNGIAHIEPPQRPTGLSNARPKPSYGSRKGFATKFEDTTLEEVFRTMENAYSVRIEYNRKDLASKLFSGRIREADSLDQVLQRIAALHNLHMKETAKGYRIQ